MGFDIVIHSGTKYLGGHSDLTAGFVAGKKELIAKVFHTKIYLGGAADPHMCYLLERGMKPYMRGCQYMLPTQPRSQGGWSLMT